jgi:ParB family chromosome partitioning protein
MQPVIVRPRRGGEGARYELVAGERRWRAAQMAGLEAIPAIVRDLSDEEAAQWALVENVQREDLNPMERAWAFRALAEKFHLTQAQIAERVGLDRASVANAVRLTELEPEICKMIERGQLSAGHGKALLAAVPGPVRMSLAQRAVSENWSVRQLERLSIEATMAAAQGKVVAVSPPSRETELRALAARTALEKQLGEHLGTKVRIVTNKAGSRGRLTVEFYGLDHFDGLLGKMGFQMR